MIKDKLYTTDELREGGIYTGDFYRMAEPCEVTGTLVLKAFGDRRTMRMFFILDDGRKIFTPVFWWQKFLNLPNTPIGTALRLTYVQNRKGIHLEKAEALSRQASDLHVQIQPVRDDP